MFNNNLRIFDVPNILDSTITSKNHIPKCANQLNYDLVDAAFLSKINRQGIE